MRKISFIYLFALISLFFTPYWRLLLAEIRLSYSIFITLLKKQDLLRAPSELIYFYKFGLLVRFFGSFFLQVLNHGHDFIKHWFYDLRSFLTTHVGSLSIKKTLIIQYSFRFFPSLLVGFGFWIGSFISIGLAYFKEIYYKIWFFCFYVSFYFFSHLICSIFLLKQITKLRFKQKPSKNTYFFTLDELWFFHKVLSSFVMNLVTVRLQDMYIPELIEISYPLSWNPNNQLVESLYQTDDYFFWAAHKNFEEYIMRQLELSLKIPKYLTTSTSSSSSTPQLDYIMTWLLEKKQQGEAHPGFVEQALDELYYIFHDHFRLTLLEELDRDPLALIRLNQVGISHTSFDNYLLDQSLIKKVCKNWEISFSDHQSLVIATRSEKRVSVDEEYVFTFNSSLKEKLENFIMTKESRWSFWDDYKFYWWYVNGEVLLQYYYLRMPLGHIWYGFPYNLWLAQVPEFALPSTAFQNIMLIPCFLIFGITTALYMKIAVTPMIDDFMTYPQWYWDFRRKFYLVLALDPMEFLGNVFYYRLVTWILIPPYLDWLYMPSGYRRRRLFLNCDLDFTRYIKKLSRHRISLNPFDTTLTDYFTTRFEQELSPLIPVVSMEQMKTLNKRKYKQHMLSTSEMPCTLFDVEPNILYYPRIMRLRIDTIFMNGLMYFEQDWINLYIEHFESYRGNTEMLDGWTDGTHMNHFVDYYNFLNFPIYHPKIPSKYLLDQTITEWYNHVRYVWRAGNWRRGEVSNVGRSTIPINASVVAQHYQAKQRLSQTLQDLLTTEATTAVGNVIPRQINKPLFAHLLNGGTYYSSEDFWLLKLKQVTKKIPEIGSNTPRYLDFSFEDNFNYPYMWRANETRKILEQVAYMEYYNNVFDKFNDDRLYQNQDGGALPYVDRDALIDGPERLRWWVARRYQIKQLQPRLWSQGIEFWKRDVILPTLSATPVLEPGVYTIFKNAHKLIRTNLSADYRTGFADVNLTFFTEGIISGDNYDYLQPLYQPAFLDFNNQIYKGPLVKPYDPVVFIEQDGLVLARASWTKILFFELYRLTTLWKLVKFLLRRYFHSLFMRAITIRNNNPYRQILKSIYLDDYAMDKIKLYNIYGPRSEYHRISFLVDNADWERLYTKYLTFRFGTLAFLQPSTTIQNVLLKEPFVESYKWRKNEYSHIDIEQNLQTNYGTINSDLVVKALNYDLLLLSRPEQSFFDNYHRFETTEALREWYDLETAYFKRSVTKQTSQDSHPELFSSPYQYPTLFEFGRRPVSVIRQAIYFFVTRASHSAPRPRYSPYLQDQYNSWNVFVPLNRELLQTFFAGGLSSTRQLPQLPLTDKHFLMDYWDNTTRFKHRLRPRAFAEAFGDMQNLTVSNQLALSQSKTPGLAATNEIMQFYHRGLTKQYGIAAAYEKFLKDWQLLRGADGAKATFTAAFWYHLPQGLTDYLLTDQDRVRFFKNKNLSFPAEQFARVRTMKSYQYYTRQLPNILGEMTIKTDQKYQSWKTYYNQYLRRFDYLYKFLYSTGEVPLFFQALHKNYGFRVHKPFQISPVFLNTFTVLKGIETPEEQLNLLLGLLNQQKRGSLDSSLLFDYLYNDLSFIETNEPRLQTTLIDSELSLPGTVISPSELRDYWTGVQRYKQCLEERKKILNTLALIYRQDRIESDVLPVMGSLKNVNFFRLMNRFSIFNNPEFNPWEGVINSVGITGNELQALWLFLSGTLSPRQFFTRDELPATPIINVPQMHPQHTQPLSHWKAYQSKLHPKPKTNLEVFREEIDTLLNRSYISPFIRKFFNITKVDITSLGILRTFGFILEDDQGGLDFQGQQGLNHSTRRSNPHTKYLPMMFQKRVERYASLISEHKVHLETNVLPPIVYAETPESFIDINLRKTEFEKERKYVAKRMKAYNDQIFKPLDYLRYPRLKERHRQREYFWYSHHFVNNWGYIKFEEPDLVAIGQQVLLSDLKNRTETLKTLIPIFGKYPNPVGLNNYMTTYSYKTIEMCLLAFNAAEKKRVSEEIVLRNEVEYIKKEYAGKYYKEIREELLEPLVEQLARIDYERQTQLALPLWPNFGKPGLWRYDAIDDIELIFDTQDEIQMFNHYHYDNESLENVLHQVGQQHLNTVRHIDYRNYQLMSFGMYSYSSWSNRMRYQDFSMENEDETKFAETKRIGRRANLNLLYLQKKNNDEIIRYLTQDENFDTNGINSYVHKMNCYRDTLGNLFLEHTDARELLGNKANFWGLTFVNFWDDLTAFYYTVDNDMRATNVPVEVFAQPSYFNGWGYHTKSPIPRFKDQFLLTGYYNVTQRFPTLDHFLTQLTSVGTPIDLFGTFSEQSLGLHPYEWFDIYDPVSERLLKIVPNSNFVFKNNLFLKRYTGFYRPLSQGEHLMQPQGLIENLEHLASGFVNLESQVGREVGMTQFLMKNFGLLPYQILEFFTFATVWGQNWLTAIYNGSFVESHYSQWSFSNVSDGLFSITESNTKNMETQFRATYSKILNTKLYNDQHLSQFLNVQESLITEEHWRGFFQQITVTEKSEKVL